MNGKPNAPLIVIVDILIRTPETYLQMYNEKIDLFHFQGFSCLQKCNYNFVGLQFWLYCLVRFQFQLGV